MTILLLGATGQLGREWQDFLKSGDHPAVQLVTFSSDQLDITRTRALAEELRGRRPDVVVNCAAYTDVDGAEEDRDTARRVNTAAAGDLAELSAELGFSLIHYSTDYVFPGSEEDRGHYPGGYPEDHPADPVNFYGRTKWEGEQAIRKAAGRYLILRVSWLCGVYGSNFVKTMLRLGRERDQLQVVNDQWGSPSFATEVVRHSWALLKAGETGTFHSTSGGLITWYDLANAVFDKKNIDVAVKAVSSDAFPAVADRPRFSKLNTEKLEAVPGCSVQGWETGLDRMLERL